MCNVVGKWHWGRSLCNHLAGRNGGVILLHHFSINIISIIIIIIIIIIMSCTARPVSRGLSLLTHHAKYASLFPDKLF
jgi:hypothetical protein